jgi:hypothetical protein
MSDIDEPYTYVGPIIDEYIYESSILLQSTESLERRKILAEDISTAPAKQARSTPVTKVTLFSFSNTPT